MGRAGAARILQTMKHFHLRSSAAPLVRRTLLAGALSGACLCVAGIYAFQGAVATAQPPAVARTLDGTVSLKSGAPVNGAVVHLKDTRSLSQKSYITAADGTYHFAQLSSTTDYEIWADSDGKKTSVKSISSFDTKPSFTIALKFND